jgi:hypothetical protein
MWARFWNILHHGESFDPHLSLDAYNDEYVCSYVSSDVSHHLLSQQFHIKLYQQLLKQAPSLMEWLKDHDMDDVAEEVCYKEPVCNHLS